MPLKEDTKNKLDDVDLQNAIAKADALIAQTNSEQEKFHEESRSLIEGLQDGLDTLETDGEVIEQDMERYELEAAEKLQAAAEEFLKEDDESKS